LKKRMMPGKVGIMGAFRRTLRNRGAFAKRQQGARNAMEIGARKGRRWGYKKRMNSAEKKKTPFGGKL